MKVLEELQQHAESIANDGDHVIATMSPGDMWAQGDVGIICIESLPPETVVRRVVDGVHSLVDDSVSMQLAPGSSMGSRHTAIGKNLHFYARRAPLPLDGPIIDAPEGVTIDHPEHGNVTLPPGCYATIYQRQFDLNEVRRVAD